MKKKMMLMIPILLLFLLIFFVKSKDEGETEKDSSEDEVIYLSYDGSDMPLNLLNYPVEEPAAMPESQVIVIEPPEMGRLGVSSVIINKKSPQLDKSLSLNEAQDHYFMDDDSLFLKQSSSQKMIETQAVLHQDLAYKIFQGQRFSAVLTHAINSDLPGMVVAEISQDIYGYQSNIALLPVGTRLVGVYNSRMKVGDTRLYIVWQRAITPDGVDITLDSTASDRLGQAGLTGFVDSHFWETFGTSALLSMMAVGTSNLSEGQGEFSNQYQQGVTEALMDTSSDVLEDRLNKKPTVHIAQGEVIHVVVAKDLDFSAVMKKKNEIAIF